MTNRASLTPMNYMNTGAQIVKKGIAILNTFPIIAPNLAEMTLIPHKASRNYSAKDFSIPSMIIAHIKIHVWNKKNRIWRWTVLPTTLLASSFYNMNINISHTCLWINQVDFLLTSQKEQEKQNPRCSKEEYLVWNLINVKKLVWFWNHWFFVEFTHYS